MHSRRSLLWLYIVARTENAKEHEMGKTLPSAHTQTISDYDKYKHAAEQGDAVAQYNLGRCYHKGNGVEQDDFEAAKWLIKAAEQGYAEAQYSLARYYFRGWGVQRDRPEAAKWCRNAAGQGYAEAQF